ncbi:unnamed protein product [Phaedon cochleariae]|uniref:ATP-dependent DNA helicase n=1 Tax=Phaedon cochleariae TaxID=80249 RepID=A0A9N9X8E3_PHACE|nr:unnamed protein product [Phaedon cochleariae]
MKKISIIVDGRCGKFFPKTFRESTRLSGDANRLGQPEYERPDNGRNFVLNGHLMDNRSVVPYNKLLLCKYNCHIDVELCGSLRSIRYLHKYVEKEPDYISVQHADVSTKAANENNDDVLPAPLSYSPIRNNADPNYQPPADNPLEIINRNNDNVESAVDNRNVVVVDDNASAGSDDDDDDDPITRVGGDDEHDNHPGDGRHHRRRRRCRRGPQPIINWDEIKHCVGALEACWRLFEFKITDKSHSVSVLPVHAENDHQVIFVEYRDTENEIVDRATKNTKLIDYFNLNRNDPEARLLRYVEIPERYSWNGAKSMWQRRKKASKVIGQLAHASPGDQTRFYLRMLLQHVGGATSFTNLRTVDGVVCPDFKSACHAMGLLRNLDEYNRALEEAILVRCPFMSRQLFGLLSCMIMTDRDGNNDGIATMWRNHRNDLISDFMDHGVDESEVAERMALYHVSTVIGRCALGGDRFTMADFGLPVVDVNDDIFKNVIVNADEFFRNEGRVFKNLLVTHNAVDRDARDGPGGTGRTFLYNCIIGKIRRDFGKPIIAVAWTGIAATLLSKGTTVHSAFKLPLKLNEDSIPAWPVESDKARIIREAPVILWDEAPMTPRLAVEAVDRYLQDLMNAPGIPMGGKIVVFGGDFRQLLPVIPREHSGEILRASLKSSYMWPMVRIYRLTENLRVKAAAAELALQNDEGNGSGAAASRSEDMASFAAFLLKVGNDELPHVKMPLAFSPTDLVEIPSRHMVADIKNLVDQLTEENQDDFHVPDEYLHGLNVAGLPPHGLSLKKGCVVMLLRNIDITNGLCNGTRLRITSLGDNLVRARILTGGVEASRGNDIFLPRMNLTAAENVTFLPGTVHRNQFPIRVAFAMTINKAQGQTFKKVGICLEMPCFAHGQLYVALSRVGCPDRVKVFMKNSAKQGSFKYRKRYFTRNIVYPSIISHQDDINVNNNIDVVGTDNISSVPTPAPFCIDLLPPPPLVVPSNENDDICLRPVKRRDYRQVILGNQGEDNIVNKKRKIDDDNNLDDGFENFESDLPRHINEELNRFIDMIEKDNAPNISRKRRQSCIVINSPSSSSSRRGVIDEETLKDLDDDVN